MVQSYPTSAHKIFAEAGKMRVQAENARIGAKNKVNMFKTKGF